MEEKITNKSLLQSIESEGIGYAIIHYYGKDIKCEDKIAEKLWKETYHKLIELQDYLEYKCRRKKQ